MPAVKLIENGRQRLDRYELVGEIASGGMATVYLARIIGVGGFQRFVAVKRLHPHLASEQEFVGMFFDEARLAASIHHPNVVPILEVGTSDRGYYLVMEYIEGDTMARLLARATSLHEKVPAPIAIRIVVDTLAGLHASHELRDEQEQLLGLVHRDVSPQNILVGIDGTSRITDFGVARATSRLSTTRTGQLKGKLAYMAPEQARGGAIDRRADLFAVGTVLWEALADRRLFKGDAEAETLNRVLFEPIPRLRALVPDTPALIEATVMKALERDPEKRHASAVEFADQLERAARATHRLASVREVAQYVQNAIGQDISQQREAVRLWLAQSEPSRVEVDRCRVEPPKEPPKVRPTVAESASFTAVSVAPPLIRPPAAQSGERPVLARPEVVVPRRRRIVGLMAAVVMGAIGWLYASGTGWRGSPPPAALQSSVSRVSTTSALAQPSSDERVARGQAAAPAVALADSAAIDGEPPRRVSPAPARAVGAAIPARQAKARAREVASVDPPTAPVRTSFPPDDLPSNPYR